MAGNTTGKMFAVTTFGSSHGRALGAVVDGCPAGLELSQEDIQIELNKRKPGTSELTTARGESDQVEILSGIFEGKTDGTPIAAIVYNKDADSSAYDNIKNKPRPGHGDYCWISRYGHYDHRGGGRGSGRNTIGHVIGGAVAKKLLNQLNIKIMAHVTKVGKIKANKVNINLIEEYSQKNAVKCADPDAAKKMEERILEAKSKGDSVGGIVETIVLGAPAGLGEPVFDKLDGDLSRALMNIGSVKGVEIGFGFEVAESTGYGINDEFYMEKDQIKTTTNTSGGILGGMSNGMPIMIRMAVKPTPSISMVQKTVDLTKMEDAKIQIKGRHDPCICPRVVPVAESAVAMVIVDHLIRSGFINPLKL
ncbi:chorismate synthase [Methanobacterium alcaliphilum]|uniref:chorismate synthase n=1 Tax=Methanobacterium alcaliphilum TaxID=392018 RepID=UPI002009F822|nr:chorismate synthase [Methanobacterium alcaliphilum]MCK9150806.1 chorismate synthase [Methanobacterium alcaliphilum]